ncbi:hypothetical protein BD309DRAFT_969171 [Dichomitus squalens]|nr:hypothetical protein BD309DRAFT_969171 [Dichomitus squalens]
MDDDKLDLTVYKFIPHAEDASQVLSEKILDEATSLVISTTRETVWYTPVRVDYAQFSKRGTCFQYHRAPDAHLVAETRPSASTTRYLKEWDEDIAVPDEEVCSLADLEEFDHGNLHRLFSARAVDVPPVMELNTPLADRVGRQPVADDSRKRSQDDLRVSSTSVKRRRIDDKDIPLRGVLPMPHFYASLLTSDSTPPLSHWARWPVKEGVIALPPHTLKSCEEYMEDPYARLAWIVPIRGCLQWDGATSATVLSDIPDGDTAEDFLPSPAAPRPDGILELAWTKDALRQLWDVLKGLRVAKNLGPLSLSFHVVPLGNATHSMEQYSYAGSHKQTTPSRPGSSPVSPPAAPESSASCPPPSPLREVDHFKVYHDAPYTKAVRNALHGWSYHKGDQKIRLLKGARLVLVDELSQGLLLC